MDPRSSSSAGSVEDEVIHFLSNVAPSLVSAADTGAFVLPLPGQFATARHEPFQARNLIETIDLEDAARVISRWEHALESAERDWAFRARLVDGSEANFRSFDCRATAGVFVVTATPLTGRLDPGVGAVEAPKQTTPRICRIEKSELAAITDVDRATESMLGWSADDLLGRRHIEFVHPDDSHLLVRAWLTLLTHPEASQRTRARHLRADGSYLWVEMINHNRLDAPGIGRMLCDVIDISEQVEAEVALATSERELRSLTEMLRELTESLPSGVAQVDPDGRVVYSNSRLFSLLTERPTTHIDDLLGGLEDEAAQQEVREAVLTAARGDATATSIESVVNVPGAHGQRVVNFVIRPLRGGASGAVVSASDITDTAARRTELERRASRDPMTDCLNRDAVLDAANAALSRPSGDSATALLFVDLDGLKDINDDLGHAAGDEMIRILARRLSQVVRGSDVVGRIGGDEFVVVLNPVASLEAAGVLASRVREVIRQPATIESRRLFPSASVGVAWSAGREPAEILLRRADEAMYDDKRRNGRHRSRSGE